MAQMISSPLGEGLEGLGFDAPVPPSMTFLKKALAQQIRVSFVSDYTVSWEKQLL